VALSEDAAVLGEAEAGGVRRVEAGGSRRR
jgi:hypothetical protein